MATVAVLVEDLGTSTSLADGGTSVTIEVAQAPAVGVLELVEGAHVSIDASDPRRPIVSATVTGGGGGGAVDSVNGQAGVVVLDAADVGADLAGSAAAAVTTAEGYTDTAIAGEVARADAAYDDAGAASSAQTAAETYTDGKITAEVARADASYDTAGAATTAAGAAQTAAQGYTDTQVATRVPTSRKVAGKALTSDVTLAKGDVGLGNVDNTADTAKPVSIAQQAALDAKADLVGGLVPTSQIPALALVTAVPVASQAAMLALTTSQVQPGDLAVRTDGAGTFILLDPDPSILGHWQLLNAPTDHVLSVNGQTGTIVLGPSDVGADASGAAATALATAEAYTDTGLTTKVPTSRTVNSKALSGDITLSPADVGAPPASRAVAAGTGLTGGGDLSADRTLAVDFGTGAGKVTQGNDGRLSDARPPTAHASTHAAAGADPITITEGQVTGLVTDLGAKAPLASPAFTGHPTGVTESAGDNSTRLASTAYVDNGDGLLVPKSLVDAKGDLLVGTADNTVGRLGVGSNGQVLTADSSQTGGLKWALNGTGVDPYPFYSGSWYTVEGLTNVGNAGSTVTAGLLALTPLLVGVAATLDRLGVECVATGTGTLRLGIYSSDSTGKPSALLLDAGTLSATAISALTVTINQAVTPGIFWLAVLGETTGTATWRKYSSFTAPQLGRNSATVGATQNRYVAATGVASGGLPSTCPTMAPSIDGNGTIAYARAA